jgi:hypothetical protein
VGWVGGWALVVSRWLFGVSRWLFGVSRWLFGVSRWLFGVSRAPWALRFRGSHDVRIVLLKFCLCEYCALLNHWGVTPLQRVAYEGDV